MGVLLWAVPKLQVFFLSVSTSIVQVLLSSDTIWNCTYVHISVKLVLAVSILICLAFMRKLEGRLATGGTRGASQATPFQKVFFLSLTLNSVGLLVAPGSKVLAVIEIVLYVAALAEGWMHFITFERTSNGTLGQVENMGFQNV
jgi:hypothetical protein